MSKKVGRVPTERTGIGGVLKVRLLAVCAVLSTLGVAMMPAQATPIVGQYRYLSTRTVAIQGADGARWLLFIEATKSAPLASRAEQALYINLSRCAGSTCVSRGRWVRQLTDAEINVDGDFSYPGSSQATAATLKSILGGNGLDITLHGEPASLKSTDVHHTATPPGVTVENADWGSAEGTLRIGGLTCAFALKDGVIGEITGIDTFDASDRTAPPAQMPAGFLTGKHKVRC